MRLVAKKYADGGELMVETADDGSVLTKELGGRREVGKRISAYLEIMCDDDEKSVDRLLEALSWLREEVERRKQGLAEKKEKSKTRKGQKTA
jgi:acetyl-CoA carboxylase carboxyltransferase component